MEIVEYFPFRFDFISIYKVKNERTGWKAPYSHHFRETVNGYCIIFSALKAATTKY